MEIFIQNHLYFIKSLCSGRLTKYKIKLVDVNGIGILEAVNPFNFHMYLYNKNTEGK